MQAWLDDPTSRRRVIVGLVAAIGLIGAVTLFASLGGDGGDDGNDVVAAGSSSTSSSSTVTSSSTSTSSSPTSSSSTTSSSGPTTTAKAKGVTTTTKGTGGTTTTKAPGGTTTTLTAPPQGVVCNTGAGSLTNQLAVKFCADRANQGLPTMKRTGALDSVAQEWANRLAANYTPSPGGQPVLDHRSQTDLQSRVLAACSKCNGWAENLAWATTVDIIWQGWLDSDTHRGNIRNGHAGEFGFGVATASDGTLFAVQNFGRYP